MAGIGDRQFMSSTPTREDDEDIPHDESAIFTLLFQECDSDGSGVVAVASLIEYIRKVQLGDQSSSTEEVYDSEEDVHKVQYNLHLLKAMLECNAVDDQVDEATYSHVIKMWVKDVRNRSGSEKSLEVTPLSDSEDGGEPVEQNFSYGSSHMSRESFETSGGVSSTHTDIDKQELLSSIQDLRVDNRKLHDRNQQLQLQMEHTDDHLKELQTDNTELKQTLKDLQQNLARLDELEGENRDLESYVHQEQEKCEELTNNVERLEQELDDVRSEMADVQNQLTAANTEKQSVEEDGQALQHILIQKEELLSQQEEVRGALENQLQDYQQKTDQLTREVTELTEESETLKTENLELQAQLQQLHEQQQKQEKEKPPMSSTPYRSEAPSLHDELLAHRDQTQTLSPFPGRLDESLDGLDTSTAAEEEFSKIIEEAHTHHSQFHQKTEQIVHELNDLISSSPAPSQHTSSTTHINQDDSFVSFESKLTEWAKKKKRSEKTVQKLRDNIKHLSNENKRLRQQLEDLLQKLQERDFSRGPVVAEGEETEEVILTPQAVPLPPAAVEVSEKAVQTEGDDGGEREVAGGGEREVAGVQTEPCPLPLPVVPQEDQCVQTDLPQPDLHQPQEVVVVQDLASLRKRQRDVSQQCELLEHRTNQMEAVQKRHLDEWSTTKHFLYSLPGSAYRLLKGVFLLLLIVVLSLSLFIILILFHDALDDCAGYCPNSPIQFLFSALDPHLQYTRTSNAPI